MPWPRDVIAEDTEEMRIGMKRNETATGVVFGIEDSEIPKKTEE